MSVENSMEGRNDLKQEIQVLVRIQELDLRIESLKKEKDSLISSLSELDGPIQAAKQAYLDQSNAVSGLEKGREQIAIFRETNRQRLSGISVAIADSRSQEAFQAKKKEAEELQLFESLLVEREQKYKKDIETAKNDLEPLSNKLNLLTEERNVRANSLSQKANEINATIVALLAERKNRSSQVMQQTLIQYERVRLTRSANAVVAATQGRCHGCNMVMPSQLYSELLKASEIQFCSRCHRIIYFKQ